MDALAGSKAWKWRATDWAAAAVAGLAAGAVLMVLDLLWSGLFSPEGPWRISHMIAPVFMGTDELRSTGFAFSATVVAVALAVHYAMGVLWGLVTGVFMSQLLLDESPLHAGMAGAMLGCALYLFNFDLLPAFGVFPWLAQMRSGESLAAHVVFGVTAAWLYWRLKRTATGG